MKRFSTERFTCPWLKFTACLTECGLTDDNGTLFESNSPERPEFRSILDQETRDKKETEISPYDTTKDKREKSECSGDVRSAIAHLQRIIALDPSQYAAYYNMGYIYYEQNLPESALVYFLKASELCPSDADIWVYLALVYRDLGRLENSINANLEALKIDPSSVMAYYNLGSTYQELHLYEQAKECYSKAVFLNPLHADALFNLGVISQQQNETQNALDFFLRAIKADPNFQEAIEAAKSLKNFVEKQN